MDTSAPPKKAGPKSASFPITGYSKEEKLGVAM
jgi:hypothetical protein